jgi:hypothetical protein
MRQFQAVLLLAVVGVSLIAPAVSTDSDPG